MPIETAADRAAFLSADEFGAAGVYTPVGKVASGVFVGIFDRPSIDVSIRDVISVDARPTFWCRLSDLPVEARGGDAGDRLAVAGEGTFSVVSIEPDGTGFVLLRLGAAEPLPSDDFGLVFSSPANSGYLALLEDV